MITALHEISRKLAHTLLSVSPGNTIAKGELQSVSQDWRRYMATARRIAEREAGAHFKPVRGIGYVRLKTDEKPEVASSYRAEIRRRENRIINAVDSTFRHANDMSPDVSKRLVAERTLAGTRLLFLTERRVNTVPVDERPISYTDAAKAYLRSQGVEVK